MSLDLQILFRKGGKKEPNCKYVYNIDSGSKVLGGVPK